MVQQLLQIIPANHFPISGSGLGKAEGAALFIRYQGVAFGSTSINA